jgi:hypothetical protein
VDPTQAVAKPATLSVCAYCLGLAMLVNSSWKRGLCRSVASSVDSPTPTKSPREFISAHIFNRQELSLFACSSTGFRGKRQIN